MSHILVVDDDANVRFTLEEALCDHGFIVTAVSSGAEALGAMARLREHDAAAIDAVLTDLRMPDMDGFALLDQLRSNYPALPVVLLTAHGSERIAVQAIKRGAYDYLAKPFDVDELVLTLRRALEVSTLRQQQRRLEAERRVGVPIIGTSPSFTRLLDAAARIAARDVPVIVSGETGTGKELIAALLHAESGRSRGPLIRFNCSAIPEQLAEAELFGYAKGAFTGAARAHRGFFAQAHGGTLVLDEIGELPLAIQPKLLRALQEGEVQALGASHVEKVDVRVVACTHRDLRAAATHGTFRADLYYRLAVVELRVPPLRERREDIPALARAFARRYQERFGNEEEPLPSALLDELNAYEWPGNVRELENCIARWVALGEALQPQDSQRVSGQLGSPMDANGTSGALSLSANAGQSISLREAVNDFERQLLRTMLDECHGNQSEAARRLGLSRVTLIDKLNRHGLRTR